MSDPVEIIHRPAGPVARMVVTCLCADWCGTCRDYRGVLAAEAAHQPDALLAWVDIENDTDLLEDLDVETFPTLLVSSGDQVLFYGPVLPGAEGLRRLLRALQEQGQQAVPVDAGVMSLAARLNSLIGVQS